MLTAIAGFWVLSLLDVAEVETQAQSRNWEAPAADGANNNADLASN